MGEGDSISTEEIKANSPVTPKAGEVKPVQTTQKVTSQNIPQAPPFKMVMSGELETPTYFNGIIYGEYGTGKTYLAATAEDVLEMQHVLYIEADGGNKVIQKEFKNRIMEVPMVRDYRKVARIFEFLTKHCYLRDKGNKEELAKLQSWFTGKNVEEPRMFKTVIVDTLNSIQRYCMQGILGINTHEWKLDAEPVVPNQRQWGTDRDMINWMVSEFRDLPLNVIFVCAVDKKQDEFNRFHIMPNLPGKLAGEVQGFVDHVGYYIKYVGDDKQMHRRIYFEPTSHYQAKNRWHGWNEVSILDPTMAEIFELEKKYG